MTEAIFFDTPDELRAWLCEHHATAPELWVGYYKKAAGRRSLTWPSSMRRSASAGSTARCRA